MGDAAGTARSRGWDPSSAAPLFDSPLCHNPLPRGVAYESLVVGPGWSNTASISRKATPPDATRHQNLTRKYTQRAYLTPSTCRLQFERAARNWRLKGIESPRSTARRHSEFTAAELRSGAFTELPSWELILHSMGGELSIAMGAIADQSHPAGTLATRTTTS
ncbi:hypothetical protein FKP32DRAFT_1588718 [Trametes sanguinea]|nr:hypothetical protein FKP32DRAFT_1588718 [Trametes sanguinea]